jgi:methylmalonyl-CoA epimerase
MYKGIHHVGIAVKSIDEALKTYRDVLGLTLVKTATVEEQGVKAALLQVGNSNIEFLEPLDESGTVARFIERRGEGMHHVCFEVDDIDAAPKALEAKGVELLDKEPRPSPISGRICFLHPRSGLGVLIELAQPE